MKFKIIAVFVIMIVRNALQEEVQNSSQAVEEKVVMSGSSNGGVSSHEQMMATPGETTYPLFFGNYSLVWKEFKLEYDKTYETAEEERKRYAIFKDSLKEIEKHNQDYHNGLTTYWKDINLFSDMLIDEISQPPVRGKRDATVAAQKPLICSLHKSGNGDIPSALDWRDKNYVTEVKNQRGVGACWAFATTGSLEAQLAKQTGNLINLSEQQLVDCGTTAENCAGSPKRGFAYIKNTGGMMTETDYPYENKQGSCRFNHSKVVVTVEDCKYVEPGNEVELKKAVAEMGPVTVGIYASESFVGYAGGIFDDPSCNQNLSHAVLVVGYGVFRNERGPTDFWVVRNSWGSGWGEGGYARMVRGTNVCGIANKTVYPVIGTTEDVLLFDVLLSEPSKMNFAAGVRQSAMLSVVFTLIIMSLFL